MVPGGVVMPRAGVVGPGAVSAAGAPDVEVVD